MNHSAKMAAAQKTNTKLPSVSQKKCDPSYYSRRESQIFSDKTSDFNMRGTLRKEKEITTKVGFGHTMSSINSPRR